MNAAPSRPSNPVRAALVPVELICFHPHNVRRDLGVLRSLATSLQRFGVMQPVVLEHHGTQLRLRAGHRRVAAAPLAGLAKVPAIVHAGAREEDEWLLSALTENTQRRDVDQHERRDAIHRLQELGCTREGIAASLGVTPRTVQAWAAGPQRCHQPNQTQPDRVRTGRGRSIKASSARTFVTARRYRRATGQDVTVDDVLDSLERFTERGNLQDALPDTAHHPAPSGGALHGRPERLVLAGAGTAPATSATAWP